MTITLFRARLIHTLNPTRAQATHVAVRDGIVLGAGTPAELAGWGPARLDERFADKVLVPGFVEGHTHLMEGALWRYVYVGWHDRTDPDGRTWPGARSIAAVIERLREAQHDLPHADTPLVGWGLDPIYFGNQRCSRADLDQVSRTRPIGVAHASLHILNVNSAALQAAGWLRPGIEHPGVPLGTDGLPTGEMKGPEAMGAVADRVGLDRAALAGDEDAVRRFARLCVRQGVTTATDLASPLPEGALGMLQRVTAEADFPVRLVPLLRLMEQPPAVTIARAAALRAESSDRLRLGRVKVVADGSIQGFSARLRPPGYHNGAPNGLWYIAPEQLAQAYELALAQGVQIHTHTNGDEATELAIETLTRALARHPSPDHRFTLQHCQLASQAQMRRMKTLGMAVNLFANHHYYWGDEHYATTVGPERAERMNACRSALEIGLPMAIHSDAPVTPMSPLFTAWCAVNRLTGSGRVQGGHECISAAQALHAVTLGPAHTLHLDGEVGSIETGKRADFAVLHDDPLAVDPAALREIGVWGTVQGGRVFEAARA
ncbi:MAG: amidohydrolase [Burkholderiales bacterium]